MRLRMCVSGFILPDLVLPDDTKFDFDHPRPGLLTITEPNQQICWLNLEYFLGVFPDDLNTSASNPNATAAAESADVRRE